jgi:hypothetical protein
MTYLEALYGSQYYEIQKQGKDGNKGRMNANLFLAALIILLILAIIFIGVSFVPGFNESLTKSVRDIFGRTSGRSIGKLLALPVFAVLYLVLSFTVGSKQKFTAYADKFMQYPDEEKKKANKKLLIPFFILGLIVFGLAMMKAF